MLRTLRLFMYAAAMLAVALIVVAVFKDDPGYEAGRSEISGKIVGLTEYQEGRKEAPSVARSAEEREVVQPHVSDSAPSKGSSAPFDTRPASVSSSVVEVKTVADKDEGDGRAAAEKKTEKSSVSRPEKEDAQKNDEAKVERAVQSPAKTGVERSSSGADRQNSESVSSSEEKKSSQTSNKNSVQYERVVTSARFAMKGSQIKLILQGNAPMVGHYSTLGNPDRVVLDLAGNWDIDVPRVPSNRLIQAVRVGQHEDKTRIVFDMKTMGKVALVPLSRNSLELCIQ